MATLVHDCLDFCIAAKNNGVDEKEATEFYWENVRALNEFTVTYWWYDLDSGKWDGNFPKWVVRTLIDMCVDENGEDEDEVTFGVE